MAEIRDANEVHAEQVAGFAQAVNAAASTTAAQQEQAGRLMPDGFEVDGVLHVHRPGPADAPEQ